MYKKCNFLKYTFTSIYKYVLTYILHMKESRSTKKLPTKCFNDIFNQNLDNGCKKISSKEPIFQLNAILQWLDLLLTKAQFSRLSLKLSTNCHIQERSLEDVNIYRKLYYMKRFCVYIQINSWKIVIL